MEHECDGDANYGWYTWKKELRFGKGLEDLETRG